jgi:hypothetical protein
VSRDPDRRVAGRAAATSSRLTDAAGCRCGRRQGQVYAVDGSARGMGHGRTSQRSCCRATAASAACSARGCSGAR